MKDLVENILLGFSYYRYLMSSDYLVSFCDTNAHRIENSASELASLKQKSERQTTRHCYCLVELMIVTELLIIIQNESILESDGLV